nr:MAG: nonstructural polyprotein [Astroviridae sp.]
MACGQAGIGKIITGSPQNFFLQWKSVCGKTQQWRHMMSCDRVYMGSLTTCWGKKGDDYFKLTLIGNGIPLLRQTTAGLTDDVREYLDAASSDAQRLRLAQRELSQARLVLLHAQRTAASVSQAQVGTHGCLFLVIMILIAVLFGLLPGASAENLAGFVKGPIKMDCNLNLMGCKVVSAPEGIRVTPLTYADIFAKCKVGQETIYVQALDEETLMTTCLRTRGYVTQHQMKSVDAQKQCSDFYFKYLTLVECENNDFDFWQLVRDDLENIRMSFKVLVDWLGHLPINILCQMLGIIIICYQACTDQGDGDNNQIKRLICALLCINFVLFTRLPLFMVMLAMTFLPMGAFLLSLVIYFIHMPLVAFVAVICYWVITVCWAVFTSNNKIGDIFGSCLAVVIMPCWYGLTLFIVYFQVPPIVQIVVTVVVASLTAAMRWVLSSDNNREAPRMAAPMRNAWRRVVTWQRGVIPSQVDITDRIVIVETPDSVGVGFRFMNYILTAGHVVGTNNVVTVKWKGCVTQTTVKSRVSLFECPDCVVKLNLPSAFQNLKPLKISKEIGSCYGSLTVFDDNWTAPRVMQGWLIFDGNWLASAFDTRPGNSGAPYTDTHGRLIGIHLGSQALLGAGFNLTRVLQASFERDEIAPEVVQPQAANEVDVDEIVRRVIKGVQVSNSQLLADLDDVRQRLHFLEHIILSPEARRRPKKKSEASRIRNKLSRTKILTEEQYKDLQDKGVSMDEIKDIVNQMREAAFQEWLMDYETDEEEDFVEEHGQMRIYEKSGDVVKSFKLNGPDDYVKEVFEKIVETGEHQEGTQVVLTTEKDNAEFADVKVKLDKFKRPDGDKIKHAVKSGDTAVVEKKDGEQIVVKRKTTTVTEEKVEEPKLVSEERKVAIGSRVYEKKPEFKCPICCDSFTVYHDVDECATKNGYRKVSKNRKSPPKKGGHQ